MYAIIATGGKQYKVSEGDVIKVEKLGVAEGETVTFDKVLLVSDKETVVGNPTVANATVTASVVCEGKDKKVIVYKYKRKTGYHKKNGHRQLFTKVKIETEAHTTSVPRTPKPACPFTCIPKMSPPFLAYNLIFVI